MRFDTQFDFGQSDGALLHPYFKMIERTGEVSLCESVVAEAPDVPQRKSKKTRRGKKKKLRYEEEDDSCETLQAPLNITDVFSDRENEEAISGLLSSDMGGSVGSNPYEIPDKTKVSREQSKNRSARSCLLRPTDVPKAPENSTQFIIDDHEDCNLYFSFERKNLTNSSEDGDCYDRCNSPAFAGFQDIDYEYESPDDLVTSAFYEQDFENIYRHAREDELLSTPRDVIMQQYLELEHRVLELETRIAPKASIVDPAIMIAKLQEELLKLQEENCALRTEKRSLLRQDSDELIDDDNVEHIVVASEEETEKSTLDDISRTNCDDNV